MRIVTVLAIVAAAAGSARADEVVLRNGARFEGEVKESGDRVTVTMDFGTITFRKGDVARIERGPSPLGEFDAKSSALKPDDVDGAYRLAMWGRHQGLDQRSRNLLEHVLVLDPDHAGARAALGFRRHEGRWLTEEEYKAEQGLVLFRGDWMKREVADDLRRHELELARVAEIETLRIRAAEAEAAAHRAAEDAAAERARSRYDNLYYRSYPVYRWGGFHRFPCRPAHRLRLGNVHVVWPGKGAPCRDRK